MRTNGNKRKSDSEQRLSTRGMSRILAVAAFYGITMVVLYGHLVIWPQFFQVGQIAAYTIFAPVSFVFTDVERLEELRGLSQGDELVVLEPAKEELCLQRLAEFRQDLAKLRADYAQLARDTDHANAELAALAQKFGLEKHIVSSLLSFEQQRVDTILTSAAESIASDMDSAVTAEYIRTLQQDSIAGFLSKPESIYAFFLQPNITKLEPPDTTAEIEALAQVQIDKGSVIVAEGAMVDQRIASQLEALRPHLLEQNLYRYFGLALLLAVVLLLWQQYICRFAPRLQSRTGSIAQLGLIFVGLLVAGLLLGRLPFQYFYYSVAFAVATLATLVVLVYDSVLALYLGLGLGLLLSIALGFETHLTLYTVGSALLPTAFLTAGSPHKRQVIYAFALGGMNALLALMVILISVQTLHWAVFVISFVSGFGAAIVALGTLPVIETLTSQLTVGKLIELANAENETLKRLKREAHGTFVHSQMVADLTEEAVRDIGGDWMLARVGALYHDIGKLHRPGFFAENIHDLSKNPHQGLPPETSVRILKDHVSDGLEMAQETRLPRELHRFIKEHHGTYLIKYFFYQAMRLFEQQPQKYAEPQLSDYSYDGPVPQTRESGVVMLADVTEAMTRARREIDAREVAQLIEYIVTEKLEQQQLVDSGLTIGDLQKVKAAFVRILLAQRHHRVTYPGETPPPLHFHFVSSDFAKAAIKEPAQVSEADDNLSAASNV